MYGYDVKLLNMTPEPRTVILRTEGLPGALLSLAGSQAEPSATLRVDLELGQIVGGPDRHDLCRRGDDLVIVARADHAGGMTPFSPDSGKTRSLPVVYDAASAQRKRGGNACGERVPVTGSVEPCPPAA